MLEIADPLRGELFEILTGRSIEMSAAPNENFTSDLIGASSSVEHNSSCQRARLFWIPQSINSAYRLLEPSANLSNSKVIEATACKRQSLNTFRLIIKKKRQIFEDISLSDASD